MWEFIILGAVIGGIVGYFLDGADLEGAVIGAIIGSIVVGAGFGIIALCAWIVSLQNWLVYSILIGAGIGLIIGTIFAVFGEGELLFIGPILGALGGFLIYILYLVVTWLLANWWILAALFIGIIIIIVLALADGGSTVREVYEDYVPVTWVRGHWRRLP